MRDCMGAALTLPSCAQALARSVAESNAAVLFGPKHIYREVHGVENSDRGMASPTLSTSPAMRGTLATFDR